MAPTAIGSRFELGPNSNFVRRLEHLTYSKITEVLIKLLLIGSIMIIAFSKCHLKIVNFVRAIHTMNSKEFINCPH